MKNRHVGLSLHGSFAVEDFRVRPACDLLCLGWILGSETKGKKRMPAHRLLLAGFGLLLAWELLGANSTTLAGNPEPVWTQDQKSHWSYLPLKRPPVPSVTHVSSTNNPIDAFVLKELEAFDLTLAPATDRTTLIRRVTFDLTGLPPTSAEVDAFVADNKTGAYERLVDRLLASPRYGERWARFWLDLARFAESDGFKSDVTRPHAWRYRDWVIQALNEDMPYDEFVRLQLAGDEVRPGQSSAFIATGFNRNWPFEDNNKVPGLSRQLMLDDITDTTASVFLGLTVGCARCHDHKYDAISQKDYYRFQAIFAAAAPKDDYPLLSPMEQSVQAVLEAEHHARLDVVRLERERLERPYTRALLEGKLKSLPPEVRKAFETDPEARTVLQEDLLRQYAAQMKVPAERIEKSMSPDVRRLWSASGDMMARLAKAAPSTPEQASGMTDTGREAPPVHVLQKGNFASPGEEIEAGVLSVFGSTALDQHAHQMAPTSGRRAALAEWLTRPDHPLTARVMANRIWQQHFGKGIVATSSDFGTQGAEPTHPELLDWLATELIARDWSLKAIHRLMVTSATYQQSSLAPVKTLAADPDNTLYGRMTRRRLEGEAVRDALLAVSGQLDKRVGGPSVFPELPPGIETRGGWTRSASAADRNRRSVYVFVRRNLKYPLFDVFDAPDSNVTCPERNISVNAPQALMLLNSDMVLDHARHLAGRSLGECAERNTPSALVAQTYRLAFGRSPDALELQRGTAFLEEAAVLTSGREGSDKAPKMPTPLPEGYDPAQGAALVEFCHVLLNLNEFVFVD